MKDALKLGFMTACSGDGEYQIKITFETLGEMQAAHSELLHYRHLSADLAEGEPGERDVALENVIYHLDDVEVDASGMCKWTDVANALQHIKGCAFSRSPATSAEIAPPNITFTIDEATAAEIAKIEADLPASERLKQGLAVARARSPAEMDVRDIDDVEMRELLSAKDVGKGRAVLKRILKSRRSQPDTANKSEPRG